MTITLLHPGEMGAAVGGCLVSRGIRVVWASENRGAGSRKRAQEAGLEDLQGLERALGASDAVLSICPPSSALDVARQVAATGFRGIYVDANAIAPARSREIGQIVEAAGASYVDGGITGLPPTSKRVTRLYLCGPKAGVIAELFAGTQTKAIPLEGAIGAASALKVCYAAWNKGQTALLAIVRALAKYEGVEAALLDDWNVTHPGVARQSEQITDRARKAWRWSGEMEEIAAAFDDANLPSGFLANAEIYRRLAAFKDCAPPPSLDDVSARLREAADSESLRAAP